ncbi:hypothetical protein P5673_030940 [Acropora cervicornis]|uniref:Uncharacterized protein n=1 Tax=Acropora cervicornis TaxID=6130 RepID=A0AAD9PTU8_ACRCE|nr:hypothetical protein P5673_030940 [Acropora cervicornis]
MPIKLSLSIANSCQYPLPSSVRSVYDNIAWESDDKHKPKKVLEALENYCSPRDNEVLELHRFWNIQCHEPFDKFLTELKTKAASCSIQEKDRMMKDNIVFRDWKTSRIAS